MMFARWAVQTAEPRLDQQAPPGLERETGLLRGSAPPVWIWPALVVAGIVCRLVQYLWNQSFWVDEASLVLNIRNRTAGMLLQRLDYHQAAPPLFLLAERGLYKLFGGSEFSLRLLPLIIGCVGVVLFALLARRLLTPWAAAVALALFSFSDRLIWHMTEVKPYGVDACIAVALTLIAAGGIRKRHSTDGRDADTRTLVLLCAASTLAVWCSYPAALVFGGLSLVFATGMLRRGFRGWMIYGLCNLPVVISFAVLMWVVRSQHTQGLTDYWAQYFVPLHRPLAVLLWFPRYLFSLFNYPAQPLGFITLPCGVLHAYHALRQGRGRTVAMLVNPIGMNLLAAAAQRYPFDGSRVTTYLCPAVLLLAAGGAVWLIEAASRSARKWAMLPATILVVVSTMSAAYCLAVPRTRGNVRPAAAFIRQHALPGDTIYIMLNREFECYWPANDARVQKELPAADQIPSNRFWIVWTFANQSARHHLDPTLRWADTFAEQKLLFVADGSCTYLYETERPAPHAEPPVISTHHMVISHPN